MKTQMKKRRFNDGGDVDYDRDFDPEAQKVYSSRGLGASYSDDEDGGLYEVVTTPAVETAPKAAPKPAPKAAPKPAPKAATKLVVVDDRRELNRSSGSSKPATKFDISKPTFMSKPKSVPKKSTLWNVQKPSRQTIIEGMKKGGGVKLPVSKKSRNCPNW